VRKAEILFSTFTRWEKVALALALGVIVGAGGVLFARRDRAAPIDIALVPVGEVGQPATTVDLNRAGIPELTSLPGIGPALAERIVAWRHEHGPFRSVEDLLRVPGVGPALVNSIRGRVRVGQ